MSLKGRLKKMRRTWMLRASAMGTFVSLALMTWAIFDPRPIPVMVAMMVGQAIGTLAFVFFLTAIVIDLWRARLLSRDVNVSTSLPPPQPPKAPP